jgi:hypothetical protein
MLENKMFDEGKKTEVEAAALAGIKSPARPVKALPHASTLASEAAGRASLRPFDVFLLVRGVIPALWWYQVQ